MSTPLTTIDWTQTGLVPTDGLEFWYQYKLGESDSTIITDASGNARDLAAASFSPTLEANVLNGQPGWYFDGTSEPFIYTGAITATHVFVVASSDEATFGTFRGLVSAPTTNWGLVGDTAGTKFFNLSGSVLYRKNDVSYAATNMQAPMSGAFALIEWLDPAGEVLDGIQIGQQTSFTARRWLGYFVEAIGFNRELDWIERRRMMLHFNLRYRLHRYGVPLYFPSKDLVPPLSSQQLVHHRFRDVPQDWDAMTQTFEYEDGSLDYNEVADDTPREWEYVYQNVPKVQKVVFDEFNNATRRANAFYFKDPEGIIWPDVRIKDYNRDHDEHKRWTQTAQFQLRGVNGNGYYDAEPGAPPPPPEPSVPFLVDDDGAFGIDDDGSYGIDG
jgi:hypothetical protein